MNVTTEKCDRCAALEECLRNLRDSIRHPSIARNLKRADELLKGSTPKEGA
jgi:hypothetical protein